MMKPFAVGERVAVYDQDRITGVITKVISDTMCMVRVAEEDFDCEYHVKQLRRLKPKRKAREFLIEIQAHTGRPINVTQSFIEVGAHLDNEMILVREVLKK